MTSTMQKNGRASLSSGNGKAKNLQRPNTLKKASQTLRNNEVGSMSSAKPTLLSRQSATSPNDRSVHSKLSATSVSDAQAKATAIEQCVQNELRRYFDMLDGEEPANLYRMVIRQAECALVNMVMDECRGNQTRASEWLGISRGNLRTKLASMDK